MINHEVKNTYEKQKLYLRIDIQMSNPVSYTTDLLQELFLELFEVQFHDSTKYAKKKRFIQNCVQFFSVSYGNWKTFNNTADIAKQVFKKKNWNWWTIHH